MLAYKRASSWEKKSVLGIWWRGSARWDSVSAAVMFLEARLVANGLRAEEMRQKIWTIENMRWVEVNS
jgi:hypothetical protein